MAVDLPPSLLIPFSILSLVPPILDFVVPHIPLSQQANRVHKIAWRSRIRAAAAREWGDRPFCVVSLKFTMVFLSSRPNPGDINNFVKPIQDALCGLIYADDSLILDVSAHLRFLGSELSRDDLPAKLAQTIEANIAGVYIAISESRSWSEELA